jgi:uncharacterized protein YcnI
MSASAHLPLRSARAGALATAGALVTIATLLIAGPASAHVTIGADDNHQGAPDAVLTFRVPNEEDSASTVKVQISFPVKDPIASVKPASKPGWTVTTKTVTFAQPITTDDGTLTSGVGQVTWTAASTAQGTPPGGFDAFSVLVGPLPEKATSLAFPTVQTYSDGTSVGWVEPTVEGGDEPEHPAPVLALATGGGGVVAPEPAESASESAQPSAPSVASTAAAASPTPQPIGQTAADGATATGDFATKSDAATGRTLGTVGLVLGALGLIAGAAAFVRSGRKQSS